MSPSTLVWAICAHCNHRFYENAKFVRHGGLIRCPSCDADTLLGDEDIELLDRARMARRARKLYLRSMQAEWRRPLAAEPTPPTRNLEDLIRSLGQLLDDIDRLAEREAA